MSTLMEKISYKFELARYKWVCLRSKEKLHDSTFSHSYLEILMNEETMFLKDIFRVN